ncbi:LIC_12616 family protein [Edwardsiella piscicida]|uniref:phage neck terminator protein n=1 Tax=Edwardsiella piscicida TaxID=1263550 RepID=UPI00370D7E7F
MIDLTVDNVIDVLADFVEPIAGECKQAQANRVPMGKGQFCILTPLRFERLSTTRSINQDTGAPSTSAMGWTEVRRVDIQVDIYGDGAGDRAVTLETVFSSGYAYDKIKAIDERVAPLYSTAAIQAPMIDAEQQWQERWTLDVSLQVHMTASFPEPYFDKAEVSVDPVGI